MTAPKVSVLLLTYNHAPYVRQSLESVLAQETTFPYEVVVCDDASSDGTREIAGEIAARYPDRVVLSMRETHDGMEGTIENFARSLGKCRGEYVATIDGDDYWTDPSKLQRQADLLDARPACVMCFHNCMVEYDDATRAPWELCSLEGRDNLTTEDLLESGVVQTSTMMMRRAFFAGIDAPPELMGDWYTSLLASLEAPVGYVDRVMSVYRQHTSGVWSPMSRGDQWADCVAFYDEVRGRLPARFGEQIDRLVCARSYLAAREYERAGDLVAAQRHDERAARGRLSDGEWEALDALVRGRAGSIEALPNPAPSSARTPGLTSVELRWTSSAESVEVRLGAPDGRLVSRTSGDGETKTGEWVTDGMLFYLQDVSGGRPLTIANTLGVARVRVRER